MRKIIRGHCNDDYDLEDYSHIIHENINYSLCETDIPGEYENGMFIFFKLEPDVVYPAITCLESFEEIGNYFATKTNISYSWSDIARNNTIDYLKNSKSNSIYVCNIVQDMRIDDFNEFLHVNMENPPTIEYVEEVEAAYLMPFSGDSIDLDYKKCYLYRIDFDMPLIDVFSKFQNVQSIRNALVLLRGMMDSQCIAIKEDLYEEYLDGKFEIPEGIEY